ncbi:MAG: DNA polymerase III subunit gamma/tau, partial [Gammaproteobacteria bacterium]|nr:DNA polymerase III subunit gamma/tau [Gammaproteobacteria bacterium]
MSYQVLARKYRPRTFGEVVGQDHAVRALMHALDADRLHHAYLFTGTRGVGKTTLARAFAKCLNCETGVGAEPCGTCSACTEIAEGRFVDLIEVDAASRTRVDDTRELLDNVQYLPSRGRFKVYLIDEVHMLSASSFNALLKTLEEPPPHVKFLLATTDPKKVPVTVLSRCLQFHLKNILPERIAAHLREVLTAEEVSFEPAALDIIAEAAQGSLRDALSVADQAIAFGGGALTEADVADLLGTVRGDEVSALLGALVEGDREGLLQCAAELAERNADFADVLASMQRTLHDIAMAQTVGGEVAATAGPFVSRMAPEDVQLCYQIALMGGRDLQFAPDPRVGFEMTLIRMLAFRPVVADETMP